MVRHVDYDLIRFPIFCSLVVALVSINNMSKWLVWQGSNFTSSISVERSIPSLCLLNSLVYVFFSKFMVSALVTAFDKEVNTGTSDFIMSLS